MTSSLADFTGLLSGNFALMEPAMIVGQALKWLPAWLTPLWVIALGLAIGAIAAVVFYGVLAIKDWNYN